MKVMNNNFEIKSLGENQEAHFQKLIRLFDKVFEKENTENASRSYLKSQLQNPDFLAFVVISGGEVIGGLTAYILPMYSAEYSEIFIYDIAVEPQFQRKGFGKKLILFLQDYCKQNGIREMFVQAHQEDEHALEFYHSTGGKAEKVVNFTYTL